MKTCLRSLLAAACTALLVATGLSAPVTAQADITYYHNDFLDSPIVATNSSGAVIWRETYKPYGERMSLEEGSFTNKIRYASRHEDDDTGLVYMGARYYDPLVGRFTAVDPVRFDGLNVHSFNRYAYASNNPFRYIDHDGRAPTPVDGVFVLYDLAQLGRAIFTGGDTGGALVDLGISVGAVFLPIPGASGIIKLERAAEAARLTEHAAEAVLARGASEQVFQRVVSDAELKATQETGLLRGGRAGENFFTDAASLDAKRAQQRLGLDGPLRDQRIEFRITNDAAVSGPRVAPGGRSGTPGGGREFSTNGPTQIEILRTDSLRR